MKYILILLAFAGVLVAQGAGHVPVRALTSREGLLSSAINAIHQDGDGLLWIGTEIGLERFDGRDLQPFKAALPDPIVLSLASEGRRLWVGTLRGLAVLEDGDALSFTRLQDMIGLTAGNLITHVRKLEGVGYVTSEKSGSGPSSRTDIAITRQGRAALDAYTEALRNLLNGI